MNTRDHIKETPEWLNNDRGAARFGYAVAGILVFIIVVWGAVAPLETAALAPGVVQVEGKRKPIQHLEGGIVSEILVANGDQVAAGDVLLRLDNTQSNAELQVVEGRRFNLRALVDRLVSESQGADQVVFSEELLVAAKSDTRAAAAINRETTLFTSRRENQLGEARVLEQRTGQLTEELEGLGALLDSKRVIAESLQSEIVDLSELLKSGYVDKQRLRDLERSYSAILGDISEINADMAAARIAITETQLQVLQLDKRFKTDVVNQLKEAQESSYDIQQQYDAVADRVERSVITAPVDGFVMALAVSTEGAVIGGGEILLEVVPTIERMIVEARVSPMDIDRVRIGQVAEVRFAVFKDAYLVTGDLTKLSADRLVDAATDIPYYAAEIRMREQDMRLLGELQLVPGMPAEVLIKTGDRTMLGYVTSPMNRMFSRSLIED